MAKGLLGVFVVFPVALYACGGSPPQTQTVTSLPSASASVVAAPTIDLSPVPMPPSVVALIHAAHLGASADMVSEWAGQPLTVDEPLADLVGTKVAKLTDTDTSADMLVIARDRGGKEEPEVRVSVAVTVKSFDAAKAALESEGTLLPLTNGAFEIKKGSGRKEQGDSDFRSCALAPADVGGRIVCSKDAASRDAVLPYLTRGLGALRAIKSDVHVEARPGPFRELARRERQDITQSGSRFMSSSPGMKSAVEAMLSDLVESFLDVDKATMDATLDAKLGMVEMKISAKTTHGNITKLLTGHPDKAETAPAIFLKLPAESDIAFFGHGLEAVEMAVAKTMIVSGIESVAADDPKLKDADRKAFSDAVAHTVDFLTTPELVYARGVDISKALPAVTGLTEQSDAAKIKAGLEQAAGWEIIGAEVAPDKLVPVFKEWAALFARPAVAASLKKDAPLWKVAGPARNAPPGTLHLTASMTHEDFDSYSASSTKTKPRPPIVLTLHTLVVPDGTRTWVVNALDVDTAVARAKALLAGAPGLSQRAGLDALKTMRANGAGFLTPRAIGFGTPITWMTTYNPRYKAITDPLMGISSQSQYTTPLVYTATETTANGENSLSFTFQIPRPAVQDVLQVGPRLFH